MSKIDAVALDACNVKTIWSRPEGSQTLALQGVHAFTTNLDECGADEDTPADFG